MLALVIVMLALAEQARDAVPVVLHFSAVSPILIGLYLVAARSIFTFEKRVLREATSRTGDRYPDLDLSQAVRRYAAFAALIVASGLALPFVAVQLAASMGWSESFVGTQLVAVATSLPEIAVTFHAVRIGALDMAVAGILGSSLFNVTIIALDDLMFAPGPIFGAVTSAHAGTAGTAIAMSAIVIVALSMPALYLANAWIAFGH